MKRQQTSGIWRVMWVVLILAIAPGSLHAWQVDVFVNGCTEGPTMSFGEGTAAMEPMPPFSGMFGVVDVYLANPAGNPAVPADIQAYYNRLQVDIKASATRVDNRWVLVAGSNARLTWTAVDGAIPANFIIAWTEKGENKVEAVVAGATFSVKAGITYTLGVGVGTADFQTDPNNPTQMVGKDDDGNLEPAVITLNMPSLAAVTSYTISINLNAGTTLLAFPVYDGAGLLTGYRPNNSGADILPADISAAAAWIVEVVAPGYDVALAWDGTDPNVLIATLTKNNTRADGDWLLSAQPTKTGLAPLSANTTLTEIDGTPTAEELLGNLIAIIQQFGTLDFDGDGKITANDVMFLYNFVVDGCQPATATWYTYENLLPFTSFADATAAVTAATAALTFIQENIEVLDYDGAGADGYPDSNDAMFLYNFYMDGCQPGSAAWYTSENLLPFTEQAQQVDADTALQTLRELVDGLIVE
ncbi:hypothetical protein [Oligosphaera ethanolica]|uniref:EF-hand domain-containing protein n=1 Tax=Oligosphaera ethanolica TaxID=760260 RepID=A0AAE3VEB1_9BACT|nr:hypothetical protein [Oligosphaera ethanolica]MDQ0288952.1 hypothetical protein [Oligosphaera ethanolica]